MRRILPVLLIAVASTASAQFVPPVPKTITGDRGLHRTTEIPLPSPSQEWVRARSPHFTTLSSAPAWRTRDVVEQLETIAAALQKVNPRFFAEGEPTRLILFARARDAAPYLDLLAGQRLPGVFVRAPDGSGTMLVDGSRSLSDRTVFHELVHDLLANSGTRLPLWLEEGLAEYFSTAEAAGDTVRFGRQIAEHFTVLRSRPPMPIAGLFAVDASSPAATTGSFYAESWALVDWMMRTDREAFYRFLSDVESGTPSADAFRKAFHAEPDRPGHILESIQIHPAAVMTIKLDAHPEPPVVEPLQHDDVLIELAKFLGTFEATRGDAERFLKSAGRNARALAALGEMRSRDKRFDESTALFEKALQLDPADCSIRLSFAEALLGNTLGPFAGTSDIGPADLPRFRRARLLAAEAVAAGADAPRGNAVIGTSYLAETDVAPGLEPLRRALDARPNRRDVALSLYALLLRTGQLDPAQKLFGEITAHARTPQAIFAAKAVFVREQLGLTNRLLAQNRNDEAIAVMERVIDATSDPLAKADLQRQVASIRQLRDVNAQITTYNEAVKEANAGRTKNAIAILDQLLLTATDAKVVSDATQLRASLKKRSKGMRRAPGTL